MTNQEESVNLSQSTHWLSQMTFATHKESQTDSLVSQSRHRAYTQSCESAGLRFRYECSIG